MIQDKSFPTCREHRECIPVILFCQFAWSLSVVPITIGAQAKVRNLSVLLVTKRYLPCISITNSRFYERHNARQNVRMGEIRSKQIDLDLLVAHHVRFPIRNASEMTQRVLEFDVKATANGTVIIRRTVHKDTKTCVPSQQLHFLANIIFIELIQERAKKNFESLLFQDFLGFHGADFFMYGFGLYPFAKLHDGIPILLNKDLLNPEKTCTLEVVVRNDDFTVSLPADEGCAILFSFPIPMEELYVSNLEG